MIFISFVSFFTYLPELSINALAFMEILDKLPESNLTAQWLNPASIRAKATIIQLGIPLKL